MQNDLSFWAKLFLFIEALAPYWLAILTSGVGTVMMAWVTRHQTKHWLIAWAAQPTARPWVLIIIFMTGFAYASFSAFDDVNSRLRASQREVTEAKSHGSVEQQRAIDKLGSDLVEAQRQIGDLRRPKRDPNWLYQDGAQVAMVAQIQTDASQKMIGFPVVTANRELDMKRPFYFREWQLVCTGQPGAGMTFGTSQQINYQNFICRIEAEAK